MNGKIAAEDLDTMVGLLNSACERLGIPSTFTIEAGSANGKPWVLAEQITGVARPTRIAIGKTAGQADWFLEGMLRTFQTVELAKLTRSAER